MRSPPFQIKLGKSSQKSRKCRHQTRRTAPPSPTGHPNRIAQPGLKYPTPQYQIQLPPTPGPPIRPTAVLQFAQFGHTI